MTPIRPDSIPQASNTTNTESEAVSETSLEARSEANSETSLEASSDSQVINKILEGKAPVGP